MTKDKLREALAETQRAVHREVDSMYGRFATITDRDALIIVLEAAKAALVAPVEAEPVMCKTCGRCPYCQSLDTAIHAPDCAHPAEQGKDAEDAVRWAATLRFESRHWIDQNEPRKYQQLCEGLVRCADFLDTIAARNAKPAKVTT